MLGRRVADRFGVWLLAGLLPLAVAVLYTSRTSPQTGALASDNPSGLVRIDVNATCPDANTQADVYAVCRITPPTAGAAPPWGGWASFDGTRVVATSGAEAVPVYGARTTDGFVLCLCNPGAMSASFQIGVRLESGVYSIERFEFPLKDSATSSDIERAESIILGKSDTAYRRGSLKPNTGAVYRFLNRNRQTAAAFKQVKQRWNELASSHRYDYRKLGAPLRECEDHVASLSKKIGSGDRYALLKSTHRALLTIAHAQSLCRNARGQGRLKDAEADSLQNTLDRLEESLTELSVSCLGLRPDINLARTNIGQPGEISLTISVTNSGSRAVSFVKIGATAPGGCLVSPAEQATFNALTPGQTARVTFTLHPREEPVLSNIVADIAYYAAGAPAHLRLSCAPPT